MRLKVLFFLCLLSFTSSFAQQRVVFSDNFDENTNEWLFVNNKEFVVNLTDGKLVFSKKNMNRVMNGCLWYKKTIPRFDAEKNFTIEFDANSLSSEGTFPNFDLQWGKLEEFDGVRIKSVHQLDFSTTTVRLSKFELGKGWTYYKSSNELGDNDLIRFEINKNEFHKYEVIQQDGLLLVKIDGKLVYKYPIEVKKGSEIGFQKCLQGDWQLDNLVIKQ